MFIEELDKEYLGISVIVKAGEKHINDFHICSNRKVISILRNPKNCNLQSGTLNCAQNADNIYFECFKLKILVFLLLR